VYHQNISRDFTKHKIEVPIRALSNTEELGMAVTLQAIEHKEVNLKDSKHCFWTFLNLQNPEKF